MDKNEEYKTQCKQTVESYTTKLTIYEILNFVFFPDEIKYILIKVNLEILIISYKFSVAFAYYAQVNPLKYLCRIL